MGSVAADTDDFVVLVTGFDAFRDEYPKNPSWEIASRLPAYLPERATQEATAEEEEGAPETRPTRRVRIVVYPQPIRVNYQVVRELIPTLWDGTPTDQFTPPPRIDLVLHIGMAGPRHHYALEQYGRRDGYALPDVDHQYLGDTPQMRADPAWPWFGVPAVLAPDIDLASAVLPRWRATAPPGSDLRLSTDAGRYLCDFIYFSSLAHLYRRRTETSGSDDARYARSRVAFLHVPASASAERIETGRVLVVELIRALVAAEEEARARGEAVAEGGPKTDPAAAAAAAPAPEKKSAADGKWYCSDDE